MNSYNHYAYGAVADWIYRYAAGIDASPLDAGFHTVVLHPVFDARLGHVSFDYESSYGRIHSDWKSIDGDYVWHVTIPANATGWLPMSFDETVGWKLNGTALNSNPLTPAESREGKTGFVIEAGTYTFEYRDPRIVVMSSSQQKPAQH
jgi:alpha-L-rhamnosidase